jgi:hypothetical protein
MLDKLESEERRLNLASATKTITETGVKLLDADDGSGSRNPAWQTSPQPESATKTYCLWCGRGFTPRVTGGSAQRFCSVGHRQAFWIAARRWTMRAIETGLLSVDCLKAPQGSVHAAPGHSSRKEEVSARSSC